MMIEMLKCWYLGRVLFIGFSLATGQAMTWVWLCWWPNPRSRWLGQCCWPIWNQPMQCWPTKYQISTPKFQIHTPEYKIRLRLLDSANLEYWPIWNQPMCSSTPIFPTSDTSSAEKNIENQSAALSDHLKCILTYGDDNLKCIHLWTWEVFYNHHR